MTAAEIMTLLNISGYGKKTVGKILQAANLNNNSFVQQSDILNFLSDINKNGLDIKIPDKEQVAVAIKKTDDIQSAMTKYNIKVISINDSTYPQQMKIISDAPILLYYKGDVSILSRASVAVIGTRNPTPHGLTVARRFGSVFAEHGFTIISGLALGCDTEGHEGCLAVNGKTCAVMGHGLESVYPAKNKKLAERILDNGGCLISEYPPESKSMPAYFVERDRIQSALSMGVIVVETDIDGGTMHTVRFALEQNRLVGCYVHDVLYSNYSQTKGNQKILSDMNTIPLRNQEQIEEFSVKLRKKWENGFLIRPNNGEVISNKKKKKKEKSLDKKQESLW